MKVSMFKNFNQVEENIDLSVILEQIRSGKFKPRIEYLRELIRQGKLDEYNDKKRSNFLRQINSHRTPVYLCMFYQSQWAGVKDSGKSIQQTGLS